MTTPIFFEDEAGEWRAQLKAANGEIVYTSEGYRDRTDAERGLGDLYATVDAVRGRQGLALSWCSAHQRPEMASVHRVDPAGTGRCSIGDGKPCVLHPLFFETGERHG